MSIFHAQPLVMHKYLLPLLLFITSPSFAQQKDSPDTFTDSIRTRYLNNGAWHYPLFSSRRAACIDTAISLNPTDSYLWQQRAMALFKQGKYEVGMYYLDKAVELSPKRYLDYRAFMKCIFQKSYNASKADFFKCKQVIGNSGVMDHPYDFYLGLCCLQLNQFDSAEAYFTICIDDKRKRLGENWVHYMHYFYRGITRYETENFDSSISDFNKCIATYPNFSDAQYYKALCLIAKKKDEEAKILLAEAVTDSKAGYTINEDNAIHEPYPYQVKTAILESKLKSLTEEHKTH